jgi:hypothetical protein
MAERKKGHGKKKGEKKGTSHDFPACHSTGNADYLAYAISFSHSHHYEVKHQPKGGRDISYIFLVEEKSALLRSTGKTGQKLVITLTPFTVAGRSVISKMRFLRCPTIEVRRGPTASWPARLDRGVMGR